MSSDSIVNRPPSPGYSPESSGPPHKKGEVAKEASKERGSDSILLRHHVSIKPEGSSGAVQQVAYVNVPLRYEESRPPSESREPLSEKVSLFKKIAQGAAKKVYVEVSTPESVFYTAVGKVGSSKHDSKLNEILEEKEKGIEISRRLGKDPGKDYIAWEITDVDPELAVGDKRTFKAERAAGNLDGVIQGNFFGEKRALKVGERLGLIGDLATSLDAMHSAGAVHGDLKEDNFLIFKKGDGKLQAKVADLGKTQILDDPANQVLMHYGNARFSAPEGVLSQKAEVYSLALIMTRVLEEAVVGGESNENSMVITNNTDPKYYPNPERRGIVRFLISNTYTPQRENTGLQNGIMRVGMATKYLANRVFHVTRKKSPENQVHLYLNDLFDKLAKLNTTTEREKDQLKFIKDLLLSMTNEDPIDRPAMSRVKEMLDFVL